MLCRDFYFYVTVLQIMGMKFNVHSLSFYRTKIFRKIENQLTHTHTHTFSFLIYIYITLHIGTYP